MRLLILSFVLLISNSVFAQFYDGTITGADELTQERLITYFQSEYSAAGLKKVDIPSILGAVDYDWVQVSSISVQFKTYDMVVVLSGNTYHGAVFNPGTLEMVGYNSDGSIYIFNSSSDKDGELAEDVEFL